MSAEMVDVTPLRERLGEYEVLRAMPKLATALSRAQAEMPPIEKTRTATIRSDKGSFSYSYADLADIFAAIRPVLAKHELAVTQDVQVQDGKVLCFTMIWHSSGESHSFGPVTLNAGSTPQNAGSAITYARRYGLSAALGIATEEDDDAQHSKTDTKPKRSSSSPGDVPASGPQPSGTPSAATTSKGRTTSDDSPASGAAADARTGNEKAPRAAEAVVGEPPPSAPLVQELRDALKKLHPGNVVWRQREKQICRDHNVESLEQIPELELQTETHNVLSKVKT